MPANITPQKIMDEKLEWRRSSRPGEKGGFAPLLVQFYRVDF